MEHNLRYLALNGFYEDQSAFVLGLLGENNIKNFKRSKVIQRILQSEPAHPPVDPVDNNKLTLSKIPALFEAVNI
jgi:hypothetical protein